jgi:tetratricopeptide (TPR) repeat protein
MIRSGYFNKGGTVDKSENTTQLQFMHDLKTVYDELIGVVASNIANDEKEICVLEGATLRAQKIESTLQAELKSYQNTIERAAPLIMNKLVELEQAEPIVFTEEVKRDITKIRVIFLAIAEHVEEYLKEIDQGKSLAEIMKLSQNTIQLFYRVVKSYYEEKKYAEVAISAVFLLSIEPKNSFFWLILGHARYFLSQFEEAVLAYTMASYCNPCDVLAYLFLAKCHRQLNEKEIAQQALNVARTVIEGQGDAEVWKEAIKQEEVLLK